ncbi:MAG TPA: TAT-variant-translocated molybdopterin oxidoreductase [Steroidobacteraceae bacterium]|nr:TAT-variant-translocated molybdopterin oxidoreductase [Steroidobacteraceae bacterium]
MTDDPAGRRGERRGPIFWKRIEELADSPDFLERARREFPAFAALAESAVDRRRFLQLTAASMALMGLSACGLEVSPRDRQAYVTQPVGMVPGRWRYFSSATVLQGYGTGVLVKHEMGRPLKIEGNPDHPASLGATNAIGQASILELYNPFRADTLTRAGAITPWSAFTTAVTERRQQLLAGRGRGLSLLTGNLTSPTLLAQISQLRRDFPELSWYQWEAIDREPARAGLQLVYGRPVDLLPAFDNADVILAVESDFLESAPGHLRFARDFAARRRAAEVKERMSRLYALESTPTLAGAKADHRLALAPAAIEGAMRRLAGMIGAGPADWARAADPHAKMLSAIAADLKQARGRALVHIGDSQEAAVHALGAAINHAIGAYGQTLSMIEPVAPAPQTGSSLSDLTDAMARGQVDTLIILADNPVYGAAADLDFARALRTVPFSIYLGEYADETAEAVHWHVPRTHEYEAWSDVRAFDGTVSIQQAQMLPRGERHSAHELLALFSGQTTPQGLEIVRGYWQARARDSAVRSFDAFWFDALRVGVVPDTAAPRIELQPRADLARSLESMGDAPGGADALTALFRPDIYLWDGRFADNGWLQEMGRPFTRLTWDNAALVSPRTAHRLGLETADLVEVALDGRRVRAPIWVLPGQADDCLTLPLGYGRRRCGPVGEDVGFNAFELRSRAKPRQAAGAVLRKLEGRHEFAVIQHEGRTLGRDLVREGSLAQFLKNPRFLHYGPSAESLYPRYPYPGIAWGMSVNLDACIGCHACVTACQAENNSPVVGKTEVLRNREMHWLRIDRYYEGPLEQPELVFQPVPCMQCENAPCEVVCPVHATVHDSQGVNVMVYNRCVGTRFCSNNCPYKVRRFNFFDYSASDPRPRESWNPEVSVRARGVMEKCTYCVQRTRIAMIEADRDNRRIRDGEVVTACQQACPTEAIVFGDQNDPQSAVARRKASPLDYAMLGELNTRPRTTYEALIRNRSPALGDPEGENA